MLLAAGSHYGSNGSLDTWWTDDTWDKFRRETYCFNEFYPQIVNCIRVSISIAIFHGSGTYMYQ